MINSRVLMIIVGLLLLVGAIWALRNDPQAPMTGIEKKTPVRTAEAGGPIDFALHDLQGKPVRLSQYRGKVVVVDVWATWCGYCVDEIPALINEQRQANHAKAPLQFVGIAMDDNIADVRRFAAKQHFNYPILYRDEAQMQPFGMVDAFPTKFIIDKHGVIVDKIVGAVPMKVIKQRVLRYL